MKVGFSTISFKSQQVPNQQDNAPAKPATAQEVVPQTQERKSSAVNEKIANVWKFFASVDQLTRSYFKGIINGIITGAGVFAAAWAFRALPKAFAKGEPSLAQVIKHPFKHTGKAGKIMAGVAAVGVFAYNAVAGHLAKNQRTAVIDHKMKAGHRDN